MRPDVELWLCSYLRGLFPDCEVGNREPDGLRLPMVRPLIVVRDDGGGGLEAPTLDCSVGVSVLWGSVGNPGRLPLLARRVAGALHSDAIAVAPGSPIAAVVRDGCFGPVAVDEQMDVSRRYVVAQYVIVED